jgi:two-component system nitrogen regulation response regulator GlnG
MAQVLELAHVAGPLLRAEELERAIGQALAVDAQVPRALREEVARERRNVHAALAKRRKAQPNDVQAVEEIFAEEVLLHARVEGKRLTDPAMQFLSAQEWPGNVRQIENLCHWITVMAPGQVVDVKDLPPEVRGEVAGVGNGAAEDWRRVLEREVAARLAKGETDIADPLTRDFESVLITKALQHTGGRRIEAAGLLGIGRNTLTRKVQDLKLDKGSDPNSGGR